jgi:LacI family transcriptional regulator
LVSTCPPGDEEILRYRSNVQGRRVDGFIILRTRKKDRRIDYLCQSKFPFVAFGRTEGPCNFPFVDEDSEFGMKLIVDHLVKIGYRRLGFIAAPDELMFTYYRNKGFLENLAKNGLPQDDQLFRIGDLTQKKSLRSHLLQTQLWPVTI